MNIFEIIEKRNCGNLRISFSANRGDSMNQILSGFGLFQNEDLLEEITETQAREIVTILLWKDLAYSGEIMCKEDAESYSDYVISHVFSKDSTFFTNALWQNYHGNNSFSFTPFTKATFDGGVIAVSKNVVAMFWVDDED